MGLYDFIIAHFSYGVLFVWSIFEGEIGLTIAGFLAKQNDLYYPYVLAITISGAVIGDTVLYLTGRFSKSRAEKWLKRYETRLRRIEGWFKRYGGWVIIFDRFIYGTHIPSLLMVGMSGFGFARFLVLDSIGVVLWAVTFTWLGFTFGEMIVGILMVVQRHVSTAVLLALFAFGIYQLYAAGKSNSEHHKLEEK
jgi:membrane protein DedA with SNARE-associated domain